MTEPPQPSKARPITVVIVDDHRLLAGVVGEALNTISDITVVAIADSCASGVAAAAEHQPDVLLLDQRLPDGLGTDILPAMLAAAPQMKVLMVSGERVDTVLAAAVSAGATGFVAKGQRAASLVEAVRAAGAAGSDSESQDSPPGAQPVPERTAARHDLNRAS